MVASGVLGEQRGGGRGTGAGGSIGPPAGDAGLAVAAEPIFARYPPRSPAGLDPREPQAFAERLEAFCQHHRALPERRGKGGLFILDITELARRFAKRWPQARENAYQLVEGTLARRLNPCDLYLALAGERFLLFMTDLGRAAAELLARRIASEITDRLCGMLPGGVACRLSTLTLDLEAGLAGVTGLAELEARLAVAEAPSEVPAEAASALIAATHEASYTPVFSVQKRLISIYALTPVATNGADAWQAQSSSAAGNEEVSAAADRWGVAQAASLLANGSFRAAVLIRVTYSTLASMRHRQPLMLACRRLPVQARRRLLIELDGLPPNLPQARLRELVSYLKPFTVGVFARLDPYQFLGKPTPPLGAELPLVEQLAGCGVIGLSLRLDKAHGEPVGRTDGGSAALFATFRAIAKRLGLRTLCHIGADRQLCRAALVAGIDHVLGEALLPPTGRIPARGRTAP